MPVKRPLTLPSVIAPLTRDVVKSSAPHPHANGCTPSTKSQPPFPPSRTLSTASGRTLPSSHCPMPPPTQPSALPHPRPAHVALPSSLEGTATRSSDVLRTTPASPPCRDACQRRGGCHAYLARPDDARQHHGSCRTCHPAVLPRGRPPLDHPTCARRRLPPRCSASSVNHSCLPPAPQHTPAPHRRQPLSSCRLQLCSRGVAFAADPMASAASTGPWSASRPYIILR